MKLDRSKPFGKISGEIYIPDGCDRPAHYEQAGLMFDAHDWLLEPGVPVSAYTEAADDEAEDDVEALTVAEVLRGADTMSARVLKAHAKRVLGDAAPTTKATIIEALQAAQAEFDARQAKKARERAPKAPVAKGVDLAAWARGHKEYLWGDVRKTIKAAYGRNVNERDDAVEFLIGQGVITANEARQDVIRAA